MVFLKHIGEIRRFLSFYVKISQYWLKFLGCSQNFGEVFFLNAIFVPNE